MTIPKFEDPQGRKKRKARNFPMLCSAPPGCHGVLNTEGTANQVLCPLVVSVGYFDIGYKSLTNIV